MSNVSFDPDYVNIELIKTLFRGDNFGSLKILSEKEKEQKTKIKLLFENKDYLLAIQKLDSNVFRTLFHTFPLSIRKDDELVRLAFDTPCLVNDKIDYALLKNNQINFDCLTLKHKKDFNFIKWLIEKDPFNYKVISTDFRAHEEIAKLSFSNKITAEQNTYYAPKNLKDKTFIKSIFHAPSMIFHIHKELFKDVPFIEELYEQQPFSFSAFPVKSTEFITRKMVLTALKRKDVNSFAFLPVEYRNDLSIMIQAIKIKPHLLNVLGLKVLKEKQDEILTLINSMDEYGFNSFDGIFKVNSLFLKVIAETFKENCHYHSQQKGLLNQFFIKKNTLKDIINLYSYLKEHVNLTGTENEMVFKTIIQESRYLSEEIKNTIKKSSLETISFSLKLEDKNKILLKQVKHIKPEQNLFKRKLNV